MTVPDMSQHAKQPVAAVHWALEGSDVVAEAGTFIWRNLVLEAVSPPLPSHPVLRQNVFVL